MIQKYYSPELNKAWESLTEKHLFRDTMEEKQCKEWFHDGWNAAITASLLSNDEELELDKLCDEFERQQKNFILRMIKMSAKQIKLRLIKGDRFKITKK